MRIFISFASEQSHLAESIYRKLLAAGYKAFFASSSIRASSGYDARIRKEVGAADRMIFLASPDALAEGKFTHNELDMFSRKWPDPTGRVMTVLLNSASYEDLPPYLGSVTSALSPTGDTSSHVVSTVLELWPKRNWLPIFGGVGLAGIVSAVLVGPFDMLSSSSERPPGVYLLREAGTGARITLQMIDIENGEPQQDRPMLESDVLTTCFIRDMSAGQRIEWSDIDVCQ